MSFQRSPPLLRCVAGSLAEAGGVHEMSREVSHLTLAWEGYLLPLLG
jgi:hypothetical protein